MMDAPDVNTSTRMIAIAIIVAALVVAGAILFVARGPDECAEWNKEVRAIVRRIGAYTEAAPGSISPDDLTREQAEANATISEMPDDCEIEPETAEAFDNLDAP